MGRFVNSGAVLTSNHGAQHPVRWLAASSVQNGVPPQFKRFLEELHDPHNILFWVQVVPTVLLVGYMLQRYLLGLTTRPKFGKQDVIYQEYFASGSSYKNFLTKLGGANGCLRLHVVPIMNIRSIEGTKTLGVQSLLLTYTDRDKKSHKLRIKPKNTAAFLEVLQVRSARKGAPTVTVNVVPEEPVPRLSLALKRYWYHLVGVGLFPTAVMVGEKYLHLPFPVFIPVFFAVTFYGFWPIVTKRVPFTYQFVMGAVWLGGAVFGGIVMSLVSFLQSVFTAQHP